MAPGRGEHEGLVRRKELVQLRVGPGRLVVGQHDPAGPGPPAQANRVVGRAMPEGRLGGNLLALRKGAIAMQDDIAPGRPRGARPVGRGT